MVYPCLQIKCLQQSWWQVIVCNHALRLASVLPPLERCCSYPGNVLGYQYMIEECTEERNAGHFWHQCLGFCFLRIAPQFFHLFGHCRKAAESCQHLHGLVQGQNTKREIASLRENNIPALNSSQHRLRRLSVRMCVQSGVTPGSKS